MKQKILELVLAAGMVTAPVLAVPALAADRDDMGRPAATDNDHAAKLDQDRDRDTAKSRPRLMHQARNDHDADGQRMSRHARNDRDADDRTTIKKDRDDSGRSLPRDRD